MKSLAELARALPRNKCIVHSGKHSMDASIRQAFARGFAFSPPLFPCGESRILGLQWSRGLILSHWLKDHPAWCRVHNGIFDNLRERSDGGSRGRKTARKGAPP